MANRVLVTGGSGFLGTNLVEFFSSSGDQVLNLDIAEPRDRLHAPHWKRVDVLDAGALRAAIHEFDPDYILHMAARTDLAGRSVADYSANTTGVQNLIDAMGNLLNVKRVIFASSRLVCRIGYQPAGDADYCPTTAYGESKVIGEKIVRHSNAIPCPWLIVRPTSIWGPWFDVPYKTFFTAIAKGYYFHPGSVGIRKSFGYVGNSVHQLKKLMDARDGDIHGRTLFLGDYPPIDLRKMADTIQREMRVKRIRTIPLPLLQPAAKIGDLMRLAGVYNPPLTSFRLNNLVTEMVYDLEPLREIAGPLPYTMEAGVGETVEWMRRWKELKEE